MKKVIIEGLAVLLAALMPAAWAQPTPAPPSQTSHAMPPPADLEPGVDTSAPDRDPDALAPAPASQDEAADAKRPAAAASARDRRTANRPAREVKGDRKAATAHDQLQLDATDITGNRELPKVMYIVPWKHGDLDDLAARPMNSLVDEVLQPIDRDVFKRQTRYYEALRPDQPHPDASAAAPPAAADPAGAAAR